MDLIQKLEASTPPPHSASPRCLRGIHFHALFAVHVEVGRAAEIEAPGPPWKRIPAGPPRSLSSADTSHYPRVRGATTETDGTKAAATDGRLHAFSLRRILTRCEQKKKQQKKRGSLEAFMWLPLLRGHPAKSRMPQKTKNISYRVRGAKGALLEFRSGPIT